MEVNLKPSLITKVRLHVLYEVTKEIVEAFSLSFPTSTVDTIKKGVLDKQLFKKILIYFLNANGNKVGEAKITIDWEKHFVLTSTDGKDFFSLDPNQSINHQISEVLPILIKHVDHMKKSLSVTKTEAWFTFTDEINNSQESYKDACKYCGFAVENKRSEPEWEANKKPKISIDFSPDDLKELGISITHDK